MSDMADEGRLGAEIAAEIKRIGTEGQLALKNLQDSFQKDLHDARQLAEAGKKAAVDSKEYTDASVKAALESALAKHEALEAALKKRMDDDHEAVMTAFNRRMSLSGVGGGTDNEAKAIQQAIQFKQHRAAIRGELRPNDDWSATDEEAAEVANYAKTFARAYLRKNEKNLTGDEFKALTTGSDPDGGYMVTPAMSSRIISTIRETSPIRQIASVEQIGTDRLEIPVDDDEAGMGWVGEEETRVETTTPRLGTMTILVAEQYAKPKVTQRLLEDAAMDLEGWLARKVADKFARTEATAFVTGDGVKKPRGLLTYAAGTGRGFVTQVVSGNATALTDTALVTLPFQIKEPYLGNARFLMKRSTLAAIALFKDLNGQYLWAPGLREGVGMQLVGYPITFADDMPAVAAGSLSVAFGDFRAAYTIVDRLGITTLRDPYSSKPFVEFYSRRRVGGDVVDSSAYVLLKTSV